MRKIPAVQFGHIKFQIPIRYTRGDRGSWIYKYRVQKRNLDCGYKFGFNSMYTVFKATRQDDITEGVIVDRSEKQSRTLTLRSWGNKEEPAGGNLSNQRDTKKTRCDALEAKGITCYTKQC